MNMAGYETYITSVGWFFAGVVLREMPKIVLEKILMRNGKQTAIPNGNGLPNSARRDVKEVFEDTLKADVLPILQQQSETLKSIAETNSKMSEGISRLVILEETRGRRK
jgi:hypothetical protein